MEEIFTILASNISSLDVVVVIMALLIYRMVTIATKFKRETIELAIKILGIMAGASLLARVILIFFDKGIQ